MGLGARRLRVVLPLLRPCWAGTTPFFSRGSLCRFAGRTWGAGCGGLAGDRGQQSWCSDCCLAQNRGRDPHPEPGRHPHPEPGRRPSSRSGPGTITQILLGTLVQNRGRGPSPRSGAGDPRPDMGPGTLIQNQAGDPRPDPGLDTLIQNRGRGPSSRTGLGTLVQIRGRVPSPRSGAGDPRPDPGWAPSSRSRLGTLLQIQAKDSPLGRWSLMPGGSASRPGLPFCSARTVSRLTSRSSLALRYFQFAQTKHTCPNQLCKKEGIESHLKVKSRSAVL